MKKKKKQPEPTKVKELANSNRNQQDEEIEESILPNYLDVIAPDGLSIQHDDYGVIKQTLGTETYFRPFYIPREGYPRKMQTNWLNALKSAGEVDILVDIHKSPKTHSIRKLQKQATMLQSNYAWQRKRGSIDKIKDLETKMGDVDVMMDEIQFSDNDMFDVSTSGVLYAPSKKELDRFSESIEDEMAGMMFKVATFWGRIKTGLQSVLPTAYSTPLDTFRNIDRRALTTYSPFISGSGKYHGGIPIGINRITDQKEFLNRFGTAEYRPANYNMGIVGISGSGKSLAMKLMIAREVSAFNVYWRTIDPEGEFVRLANRLGEINLNISEESDIIINPCALNYTDIPLEDNDEELELLADEDRRQIIQENGKKFIRFVPIREKTSEILSFFDIVARGKGGQEEGLNVFERNYIEDAIRFVFNELGITTDPDSLFENKVVEKDGEIIQSKARKPEPEIKQIFDYLVQTYGKEPKAERLINAIRPFLRDGSKPIFDGQTYLGKGINGQLNDARLVNFNISQLEEGFLRPIAYHVILNYLWEHFAKNMDNATKRKVIGVDEMWQLVDSEQTVNFLEKCARRIRKRNGSLTWASQDFVRILENPRSRGVLTSTFSYLFLEQNKIDKKKIEENFDLTQGELNILFNNPDKGEGVLRVGRNSVWLKTDPSEDEMTFIESNEAVLQELLRKRQLQER